MECFITDLLLVFGGSLAHVMSRYISQKSDKFLNVHNNFRSSTGIHSNLWNELFIMKILLDLFSL